MEVKKEKWVAAMLVDCFPCVDIWPAGTLVEDILLQQGQTRFHCRVVGAGVCLTHRATDSVSSAGSNIPA
jgi:hypothetical protein